MRRPAAVILAALTLSACGQPAPDPLAVLTTTSSSTTTAPPATTAPAPAELVVDPSRLTVAPEVWGDYDRDLFPHWSDFDGNGCDTRQEVLIRDSDMTPTFHPERVCRVVAGRVHLRRSVDRGQSNMGPNRRRRRDRSAHVSSRLLQPLTRPADPARQASSALPSPPLFLLRGRHPPPGRPLGGRGLPRRPWRRLRQSAPCSALTVLGVSANPRGSLRERPRRRRAAWEDRL